MKSNFALRTFTLLFAWLLFENFNVRHNDELAACRHHSADCCKKTAEKTPFSIQNLLDTPRPPYKIKTIVLDAGHGGKDPGCVGASAYEKENALAIVLRLGAYMEELYPEIKVIYTRTTDVFVELNERAAIANRNNADLFISVHCNSLSVKSAHGTETYVLGLHRSKDNLEVAKRENASIYLEDDYKKNYEGYDPDSPEAEIFANLWQSAYLEQSILLAGYVQQFSNAVAFREDRGVKQAGFLVLRETAMPSVLIETGYLTNADEEAYLASEEGREQMALAIFQAFEAYKRHLETGKAVEKPLAAQQTPPQKPVVKTVAAKTTPAPKETPASGKTAVHKTAETGKKEPAATGKGAANPPVPAPTVYTIFLLAWPNKLDPNVGQLSLLANVREIKKDGKYHYYAGQYSNKADAEQILPEIQNMGFKSAAIVAQ